MLQTLKKITDRAKKRVGRGGGSGKGFHTAGRGTKGHTARQGGTIPLWFEGGQLPLIKRLPYLRGKFRFKSLNGDWTILKSHDLEVLKGGVVSPETLYACGLIRSTATRVKIVTGTSFPKVSEVRGVALTGPVKKAFEKSGVLVY